MGVTASSLDKALKRVDYSETVEARVAASPETAFQAALDVTVREMLLSSALLTIRGLPGMVRRRRLPRWGSARPFWDQLIREPGFMMLVDPADRYAAFGYVGRPWKPAAEGRRLSTVEEFLAFGEPGYAKVVMDLAAEPDGDGARLRTETRIHLTDDQSRRAFGRYWLLVRLGSNAVRRDWFRAARRRATASRGGGSNRPSQRAEPPSRPR